MGRKLFRVDRQWVNLAYVKSIQVWPPLTWSLEEDEKRPRLYIGLMPNDGLQVTEREAVAAGFADIAALETALIEALEAFDG